MLIVCVNNLTVSNILHAQQLFRSLSVSLNVAKYYPESFIYLLINLCMYVFIYLEINKEQNNITSVNNTTANTTHYNKSMDPHRHH